ncbi:hypothetical protein CMPELA_09110 [Cupriavidus necator]|uniref:hypothetical protein n=1 Tax=Cupriavidus necator TaxID=106590 RepID=UPI00031848DE|nr:hypothetical protein [Cupriavidus necator]QQB76411.1 hypothetical protein I6H87_16955 [Cupriavidus necator]WKA42647.1 hypothetical protein QWP09_09165 [Cupriavidus necator]
MKSDVCGTVPEWGHAAAVLAHDVPGRHPAVIGTAEARYATDFLDDLESFTVPELGIQW